MRSLSFCLALLLCWVAPAQGGGLTVGIRGQAVTQDVFSLFAAPGEVIQLGLDSYDVSGLRLTLAGEPMGEAGSTGWTFAAPHESGLYRLLLEHAESGKRTRLNLFVGTVLADGQKDIEGYRIGPLPPGHSRHPELYRAPRVYIRVTPENIDTRVSEHFTLRQFLCKQESDFPKFVVIKESLLVLLEGLIEAVQEAGYPAETFGIISGYRTPYYNHSIGNVPNSRHVYGDAMDFFVDLNQDGALDDLNKDGRNNRLDVDLLFKIVDGYRQRPQNQGLPGGIGDYYKTSLHGGFIHVDTRGYTARW